MKKIFLLLLTICIGFNLVFATTVQKVKSKPKTKKQNLNVRYFLTDKDHNPTVNFIAGEDYFVYLSIQNMTQDSVQYKKNSGSGRLFHFMALKSSAMDFPTRFNNQNESLQIPIYADQDTVLKSLQTIDDYQQVLFYKPGFYTIQIMPNLVFADRFKKDWGNLKFEIECHENPNQVESDPLKELFESKELTPLLKELEKLPEMLDQTQ